MAVVGRFAARFSVRALDVTVDPSLLWVGARPGDGRGRGARLRPAAAVAARAEPAPGRRAAACGSRRARAGRLRAFAVTQIALSFVLLAGAGMLLVGARRAADGEHRLQHCARCWRSTSRCRSRRSGPKAVDFYQEATRRIEALPGVERVAVGNFVPWRDAGMFGPGFAFAVEGYTPATGEEDPRARLRIVTPGFFAALGVPLVAGRDFTDDDRARQRARRDRQPERRAAAVPERRRARPPLVVDRSRTSASPQPRRIVGVVADVDDENVVPGPALTVYHPLRQMPYGGRLFVHASGDPYALVPPVTRIIRELSADQPVERAATLEDVRARGAGAGAAERLRAVGGSPASRC